MKNYETHVCLVSHQVAPNLLPLLDEAMKPKRVILVVTPEMKERANYLASVIKPMGIETESYELQKNVDFAEMQDLLLGLITAYEPDKIALNVTGGTKWMAIAAQEIFRLHNSSVFYVNIDDDSVLFLPANQKPHKLACKIKLETYIKAHGYTIVSDCKPQGLRPELRDLCQRLVAQVKLWGAAIGQLNLLASHAEERRSLGVRFDDVKLKPDQSLHILLSEFETAGILEVKDGTSIRFVDEDSRIFANGGWLEHYINSVLNSFKADGLLQDSPCLNLKIRSPKGSENEIDVAFMANNHLHLIECKTRNFSGGQSGAVGKDTLYKLDSISDLGGLATRSMLVSYRDIGKNADLQRAKDLRIKIVQGPSLLNLKEAFSDWIK